MRLQLSRAGTKANQGGDFQIVVAMHWLIRLISDDSIESIQAESNGISGLSERITVDDIVVIYKDQNRRYIQVKKNQKENRAWSIADVGDELIKVKEQLKADITGKVDFYSATPFGSFKSLADACKEYPDLEAFEREAGAKPKESLNKVATKWSASHQESFELMQRVGFGSSHTFDEWERLNQQELTRLVTNSGIAVAVLGDLIKKHQSKLSSSMFEISASDVIGFLEKSGVIKSPNYAEKYLIDKLAEVSRIGRDWNRAIGGETYCSSRARRCC